ncbi:MAG: hypothetical protein EOP04_02645 [Proteobacteria bacterium]|nr:MAG: hypothetical protein EOP04_02645 [Pseudomonadota bacterium]
MKKIQFLFGNPFDDKRITSLRLVIFAQHASEALKGEYAELAVLLNDRIETVLVSLGKVAFSRTEGGSDTKKVDAYLQSTHNFMKKNAAAISVGTGGEDSEGYRAFFPKGLTGYRQLTKTEAPELFKAISNAVAKYGARIAEPVRAGLAGLERGWFAVRGGQQSTLEGLDATRNERDEARIALEFILIDALHDMAKKHKADPKKGLSYFQPSLLFAKRRKKDEAKLPEGAMPAAAANAEAPVAVAG